MLAYSKMLFILYSTHHVSKIVVENSYPAQFEGLYRCTIIYFLFRFAYNIVEVLP